MKYLHQNSHTAKMFPTVNNTTEVILELNISVDTNNGCKQIFKL